MKVLCKIIKIAYSCCHEVYNVTEWFLYHDFWMIPTGTFFKNHLFLAMLGLCCCVWTFSSCSVQASHCDGFFCWGAWDLGSWAWSLRLSGSRVGSVVVVHEFCYPEACRVFLDQRSNSCPHVSRRILNHWTTREVPNQHFFEIWKYFKSISFCSKCVISCICWFGK